MAKLDSTFDILNILSSRRQCVPENDPDIINKFIKCETRYFDYFMNLSDEEIEKLLCVLPVGSILFHTSNAKNIINHEDIQNNYPPEFPMLNNNISAIKKVLNAEIINKALFSIKMKTDADDTISSADKERIYNEEKNKFYENYREKERQGIFMGKKYLWCNSTIDTNIMVDVRLMKSLGAYIVNTDLYLLDYFKLGKIILYIEYNPGVYEPVDINFFKKSLYIPKEITSNNDDILPEEPYFVNISYNDKQYLIRNRYSNSLGDAVILNILNYVLSIRGFKFRVEGYSDYDLNDNTYNFVDPNSNSIGDYLRNGPKIFTCREIMICQGYKYLSYLSSYKIHKPDDFADTNEIVTKIKQDIYNTFVINRISNMIKHNGVLTNMIWCFNIDDIKGDTYKTWYSQYGKNIRIMPHYRYNFDNILINYTLINMIEKNTTSSVKTIIYDVIHKDIMHGGASDVLIDQVLSSPNTNIFTILEISTNYESVFKYLKTISNNSTEEKTRDFNFYEIKAEINSKLTKIMQTHKINSDPEKLLYNIYKQEIKELCTQINEKQEEMRLANQEIIGNTVDKLFIYYLKGSNAMKIEFEKLISPDFQFHLKFKDIETIKKEYTDLNLNISDFDFNLSFNPKIMENIPIFDILRKDVIKFLYSKLSIIKHKINNMINPDMKNILIKMNSELSKDKIINDIKQQHYIYPIYSTSYNIGKLGKEYLYDDEISPLKITINDFEEIEETEDTKKIQPGKDYTLIRLGFAGITNNYKNTLGEIIDFSIIKKIKEAEYFWKQQNNINIIENINVMNYIGLYFDINDTILSNLISHTIAKMEKRLKRLTFFETLIISLNDDEEIRKFDEELQKYSTINRTEKYSFDLLKSAIINKRKLKIEEEIKKKLEHGINEIFINKFLLTFDKLKFQMKLKPIIKKYTDKKTLINHKTLINLRSYYNKIHNTWGQRFLSTSFEETCNNIIFNNDEIKKLEHFPVPYNSRGYTPSEKLNIMKSALEQTKIYTLLNDIAHQIANIILINLKYNIDKNNITKFVIEPTNNFFKIVGNNTFNYICTNKSDFDPIPSILLKILSNSTFYEYIILLKQIICNIFNLTEDDINFKIINTDIKVFFEQNKIIKCDIILDVTLFGNNYKLIIFNLNIYKNKLTSIESDYNFIIFDTGILKIIPKLEIILNDNSKINFNPNIEKYIYEDDILFNLFDHETFNNKYYNDIEKQNDNYQEIKTIGNKIFMLNASMKRTEKYLISEHERIKKLYDELSKSKMWKIMKQIEKYDQIEIIEKKV
jgi:hypothetical protein